VRELGLKNHAEWLAYCRGERSDLPAKPANLPASPYGVYGSEFRERGGIGAWLGTNNVAQQLRRYRPYNAALRFVHRLGLKSKTEWLAYCRGERKDLPPKPADIPAGPAHLYGDVFRKRGGMGAWLGTSYRRGGWRSYNEAVVLVHTLGFKNSSEWQAYCRGKRTDLPPRPADTPAAPWYVYRDEFRLRGGMGAWLGTGKRKNGRTSA
jgi:hypothetical protein